MAYTRFVRLVASDRGARKIGVLSSTLFALAYAFAIGMVFRNPVPVPEYITVPPQVIPVARGPISQVPWPVAYVDRYWTISVNLEVALSMLAISTLIGLNASALCHISRRAACCISSKRTAVSVFASALPAFFGFFSCWLCAINLEGLPAASAPRGRPFLSSPRPFRLSSASSPVAVVGLCLPSCSQQEFCRSSQGPC